MDEKELLRESGLKITDARLEIYHYLSTLSGPSSAEALFVRLRKKDIDLSTLYRTLNTFAGVGLVKKEVGPNKENLYSLAKEEEVHLLVCLRCGKKVPLEGCPYHEVNETLERQTGFEILDHNTEIYGICPDCRKN